MSEFDSTDWEGFGEEPGDHRERRDLVALLALGMHARETRGDLTTWLNGEIVELRGALDLWANDPTTQNKMVKEQQRYWLAKLRDMETVELVDAGQEANRRENDLIERTFKGYANVSEAFLYVMDSTYRFGVMSRELAKLRKILETIGRL